MKIEWLHSKFPSQTEMIGHLYDRHCDDDEEAAKRLDEYFKNKIDWKLFKLEIKKGDELWLFRNEPREWNMNNGKEGYSIVRNGEVFANFLSFGNP